MSEEIFIKILNNSATEEEKSSFYKLLEEDNTQREIFLDYKTLHAVSNIDNFKYSHLQEDSFERFWSKVDPAKRFMIFEFWYRYAAIFIIALLMGFLLRNLYLDHKDISGFAQIIEYTSEKGSVSTIHLEDGSAIWLSSGSKITIQKQSSGEMTAKLDGEAYFDMIPSRSRKFTVDLGYFKVKDIGTKFNIRAYSTEAGVYATLVDGQIDLYREKDKPTLSMKPGEYMQFDKQTNHIAVSQQDPTITTAWKDGKFVFINKTMSEICQELENWYNVEITIQDKTLANTKYTSVIKRSSTVNMVLKMLSLTDKINYKIDERKEARDIVYIY